MNNQKFLRRLGMFLTIAFLTGCTVYAVTPPQPIPLQPQQPEQPLPQSGQSHQPGQPQPGQQPGAPGSAPLEPVNPSFFEQNPESVLIDQTVTIPGGGGSAEVSFSTSGDQRIQIVLTASNPAMQPYGNLQYPDGTSQYNPPLNTAANGVNQVEVMLNQTGQYVLTVFDGSNQGGPVSVKIVAQK